MQIRAGFEISYLGPAPTPMTMLLSVRPERAGDLVTPQRLRATPAVETSQFSDPFGNLAHLVLAPRGQVTFSSDFTIEDSGLPDPVHANAAQHPVHELPAEALQFLLGSRYCETDLLSQQAWVLFGGVAPGWARVQAIVDFVHERITFGYAHARCTRTATEAYAERRGVCRDFAHLAITLCRCMNIPARYCTGYLGDIGIPPVEAPMDFSAWFEVFLGGRWHTFDARHNTPRIGRILMAYGRDAADVAISTIFGAATLTRFTVTTDEVEDNPAMERVRRIA